MLESTDRMLALGLSQRGCALVIAALLLGVPASAQDPVDPNRDTASAGADEPTDPTDFESGLEKPDSEALESDFEEPDYEDVEEPDSEDLEESDSEDLEEALRTDALQQTDGIEKILVTGEKQSTLQDAPTSSTSFSASDLQALRIEDIADLADYTPNLEINTAFAASNPTIFIRGVGLKDYNANAAGAVAIYQDGVNINSPAIQLGQLFDIDGIDVLRGPQGSLNGRNATAGAILIRSALPDGEFGVSTNLTYGNYDNKKVEAAIDIPLVKDVLSMRVSGTAQWRDGYTKNQCAGWNPEALGFRRVDEASSSALYWELTPAGQYENGDIRATVIRKQNGSATKNKFVYLNYDKAVGNAGLEAARDYTLGVGGINKSNPWVLTEDLVDENGNPVFFFDASEGIMKQAVAGTPVTYQSNTLTINDVDDICIIQSPGNIVTLHGENSPYHTGDPEWQEGTWQTDKIGRVQPTLEEFAGLKRWTNNVDNWAARVVLLFEPLDNMEWMANLHGTQNRGDSLHFQMLGASTRWRTLGFFESLQNGFSEKSAAVTSGFRLGEGTRSVDGLAPIDVPETGGGNPHSGFYDSDGLETIDAWGINGRGSWDLGAAVITLLYDYEWYDRVVESEGDANPQTIIPELLSDSAWQTTEELRVEGEGERYRWTTGFFFLHEQLNAGNAFPHIRQYEMNQKFSQMLTSWAPYASGEVDLVEEGVIPGIYQLTLGAGARYSQEKKEFSLTSSTLFTTSRIKLIELPEETRKATWKEWTGDVQLSYTPFSNEYGTLVSYLKYGRGFKGGHFNAGLTIKGGQDFSQLIDPVEPEFIDAVECGIRSRWFDDRVILNAAFFRYWYQDLQVFDVVNKPGELPIQQLLNSDAKIRGAEAELRVKPLPGFLIAANMGWLDSEFEDFAVRKAGVRFNHAGNPLVAAPEWNFAVIIKYEIPLFGWGSLVPHWDVNYRSKMYLDPQMVDPISQDAYWLHNARIAYRTPGDRIELAFWVSNVFEEEYKIEASDLTRSLATIREVWGEPRMYGVTLSFNW